MASGMDKVRGLVKESEQQMQEVLFARDIVACLKVIAEVRGKNNGETVVSALQAVASMVWREGASTQDNEVAFNAVCRMMMLHFNTYSQAREKGEER